MSEQALSHKLAAILYADVEGYSRLTGADEAGTHRTLRAYLDLFAETVKAHRGEVKHYAGDAVLADFTTVSDALNCAVAVQQAIKEKNNEVPQAKRVQFRIGLNLGEVIVDRGEVYGNGVNVAARLETLAEPGGICISGATHDAIGNKLPLAYEYLGEHVVKNIDKPVRSYRVNFTGEPSLVNKPVIAPATPNRSRMPIVLVALALAAAAIGVWRLGFKDASVASQTTDPVLAMPTGPAIAVLPFTNMSGDPKEDYFSDGLTEDIIAELARFRELNVFARNTTFQHKGQSVDVPAVGRKLGAKYVLEGSVRKSGSQLRVTAQLIDAQSGTHVWAERYDRDISEVFAVQDEIAGKIAATITGMGGVLVQAGREAAARKRPDQLQAYDYVLHATMSIDRWTPQGYKQSKAELAKAIELDPTYGRARQEYAWLMLIGWFNRYEDVPAPPAEVKQNAIKSVDLDPGDAHAHRTAAFGYFLDKQLDLFAKEARIALDLAPNDAEILVQLGALFTYNGQWERGVPLLIKAQKLNPASANGWYQSAMFIDLYRQGKYEQAFEMIRMQPLVEVLVGEHSKLVAVYAELGRLDEAKKAWSECRAIDPKFSVQWEIDFLRLWNVPEVIIQRFVASFAKAGFTHDG